jgi:hypothetical protein
MVILPILAVLWILDEAIYWKSSEQDIKDPVIIISMPRAGTTSFHCERFVTPTMLEFYLLYLSGRSRSLGKNSQASRWCHKSCGCSTSGASCSTGRIRYISGRMALGEHWSCMLISCARLLEETLRHVTAIPKSADDPFNFIVGSVKRLCSVAVVVVRTRI